VSLGLLAEQRDNHEWAGFRQAGGELQLQWALTLNQIPHMIQKHLQAAAINFYGGPRI